jgi:hypothetical protein
MAADRFAGLRDRLAAAMVEVGAERQARLLEGVEHRPAAFADLPVLAHLDDAVARAADEVDRAFADVVGPLAASVRWQQTAAYVREPPDPSFLARYGHATLGAGDDVAIGLLLLGPGVHYPRHHHPAEEFYLPAGAIRWVHAASDAPALEPAGVLVHHAPWQPHGMWTDDRPALLAYVWTGEVATASSFC